MSRNAFSRFKELVFGKERDPLDPHVFHQLSLVALLAWVGLGADGLSSSCYGPEQAYLALGNYRHLALLLVIAMTVTVYVISFSYSRIIELFPSGGGGYLVSTKLLGPIPGVISGCALVFDYVLTIAISIAAGVHAIFSFVPTEYHTHKLPIMIGVLALLTILNLRGIKESVAVLAPIFACFVLTHLVVIGYGIFAHLGVFHEVVQRATTEFHSGVAALGMPALVFILFRAYALGAGTYTGIEAVSNGLPALREPKVITGKKTMQLMALSLSLVAGGILVCYLLNDVERMAGMTLNAVLIQKLFSGFQVGGVAVGDVFYIFTLLTEGGLLFVAAQTGFLDGPRVLANMALDSWVPHRFAHLSDRLVTRNGIWLMSGAAAATLAFTHGDEAVLVVMYSLNVFVTFTLSQVGMVVHWWQERAKKSKGWRRPMAINLLGSVLTTAILIVTVALRFKQGAWVTVATTTTLVITCLFVHRHYRRVNQALARLDETLLSIPLPDHGQTVPTVEDSAPTAVLLVSGYNGLGIHTLLGIHRIFGSYFKNFLFVSVGVIDSSKFKGVDEVENLRLDIQGNLDSYVRFCNKLGMPASSMMSMGTDVVDEIEDLCKQGAQKHPRAVFFTGKLIFPEENVVTRLLHNQTAFSVQRRLQFGGMQLIILPIRVL